jgi:GH25 family lysozyme M1 (1,4-beta-N-acetylmuramidase)
VLAQGFVLLSQQDTDAPACPAVATVSTLDQPWDDGGWNLGADAAAAGSTWIDRPYFKGNPSVGWFVENANSGTGARAWIQVGNEQNLPIEEWVGGPEAWFAFEDAVRLAAHDPERLLAMPPSPGMPGWESWVRPAGHHACHAYGTFDQMRGIVEWYLEHTAGDVYITETNFGAGNTVDIDTWAAIELVPFLDWCASQERVKVAAYFCWCWRTPDSALTTPLDARGTAIETVIRDWTPPDPPSPGPEESVLEGTDVSNWQAEVSWPAVAAAGKRFAIVKASEDPAYRDPYFGANWRGIKAANLTRGAYHFARPSRVSPAESVAFFAQQIAAVGGLEPGDLVALDIEDTDVAPDADLAGWVVDWLVAAETELGLRPLVYSGSWYLEPHVIDDPALADYPLWLAAYQDTAPDPPAPWDTLTFWQYSAHGTVPGISGDADLNQFLGTEEDLAALGYGATTPPGGVQALRDRTWALCDQLQAVAAEWQEANWPSAASGIGSGAEAIKSVIRAGQGEM